MSDHGGESRELDLSSICDGNLLKLVTSWSEAKGVPRDVIFYASLTAAAACMKGSSIVINEEWRETCAVWCAVVSKSGSRRSTTLNAIEKVICAEERGLDLVLDGSAEEDFTEFKQKEQPVTALALLENINELFCSSKSSPKLHTSLKQAFDGCSRSPRMNVFGFLLPSQAKEFLKETPADISSRILIGCPTPVYPHMKDMKIPMPTNTPCLEKVLEVLSNVHHTQATYSLTMEAKAMIDQYHDRVVDCMKEAEDDDKYTMLSKAPGLLVRISCILTALRQALKNVVYKEVLTASKWDLNIRPEDIEGAKILMDHVTTTKLDLLETKNLVSVKSPPLLTPPARNSPTDTPPAKRPRLSPTDVQIMQMAHNAKVSLPHDLSMTAPAGKTANGATPVSGGSPHLPNVTPAQQPQGRDAITPRFNLPNGQEEMPGNMLKQEQMNAFLPWGQFPNLPETSDTVPGSHNFSSISGVIDTSEFWNHFPASDEQFLAESSGRLKKLLEFYHDFRIAPSVCAQRHLIPPLQRHDMERYDTQTKYPVIIAKEFLHRVAQLGFGFVQNITNSSTKRRSCYFEKYPSEKLSQKAKDLLVKLGIKTKDYDAPFQQYIKLGVPYSLAPYVSHNGVTFSPPPKSNSPEGSTGVGPPLFPEHMAVSTPSRASIKQEPTES